MKRPRKAGDGLVTRLRLNGRLAVFIGACVAFTGSLGKLSAASVTTIAGGPTNSPPYTAASGAGFRDGPGIGSTSTGAQFNLPGGVATDPAGIVLYIADSANGAVRKVDLASGVVSTLIIGLSTPIDVAVDGSTNLYVLTQGDGLVRKYDLNLNAIGIQNATALTLPTAIALNGSTNILVAQLNGAIIRINQPTNTSSTTISAAGSFSSPGGLEVLDNGSIVVSDTGNHAIRYLNASGVVTNTIGLAGTFGTNNGPASIARFHTPHHLSKAGNNVVVVADTGNHQVRVIDAVGNVSGLYGVDSNVWINLPTDISPPPGWVDGNGPTQAEPRAESRLPEGLVVDGAGNVFVSERYYHIVRKVVTTGLTGPGGSLDSSGGGVVLNRPSISMSPDSGYFPSGTTVTVSSSSSAVFYTTDGSDPSTNSPVVSMSGGLGTIKWFNTTNDLSQLKVLAVATSGTNIASTNISGVASTTNVVGVPADVRAGIGSTVYVPVVINLRTNDRVRSIGFRVEIAPATGAPAAVTSINVISTTTNDFAPVVGVSSDGNPVSLQVTPYSIATTKGVAVSSLSPTNFLVTKFGVLVMLEVKIPGGVTEGNTYAINVSNVSGTSDGGQTVVALGAGTSRIITVANVSYLVGDTSPGRWYNAGDFGDGNLDNSDVNNVFLASLGLHVPFANSDAFNAMDVFPELPGSVLMGDGNITMNDWLTVNERSLRLPGTVNFSRAWATAGARTNGTATLPARIAASSTTPPGDVWYRNGSLNVSSVGHISPGSVVTMPVSLKVAADMAIDGIAFRVIVTPIGDSPALTEHVRLVSDGPLNILTIPENLVPLDAAVFTRLASFQAGSNFLASVQFRVPAGAKAGDCYKVSFASVSGTVGQTGSRWEPTLENMTAAVCVLQDAVGSGGVVSEQWIAHFFGTVDNPLADLNADPDGDGVPNWKEFLAGTDPTKADSKLRLENPVTRMNGGHGETVLRLLSAPGKTYVLEATADLGSGVWTVVATFTGDGNTKELIQAAGLDGAAFYRVRVLP